MFKLSSPYAPDGDQPEAIEKLAASIEAGNRYQTLLGVTGSGKTHTMARIIEKTGPTLIMTQTNLSRSALPVSLKRFFPTITWSISSGTTSTIRPKPTYPVRISSFGKRDSPSTAETRKALGPSSGANGRTAKA